MQGEVSHIQIFTLHLFGLSIFTAMTISQNNNSGAAGKKS